MPRPGFPISRALRSRVPGLALVLLAPAPGLAPERDSTVGGAPDARAEDPSADPAESLVQVVERGDGLAPLRLPHGEELEFEVDVQITVVEAAVAKCTMTSRFEEYRPPLLLSGGGGGAASPSEPTASDSTAVLALHAVGDHILYTMDARLETRLLPQDWPAVVHRLTQQGSDKRRRETLLGRRDGVMTSSYRRDTSRGAPRGTRVWVEPELREVPEGTLDMVSAIYLIRTLVRDGLEELRFPLINKREVWDVVLRRGETRVLETAAGRFRALEVLLETAPDAEVETDGAEFEGPFGLKGAIHLWVESTTGVPVLITGDLPAGLLTLGVEIGLESYRGTPAAFRPL